MLDVRKITSPSPPAGVNRASASDHFAHGVGVPARVSAGYEYSVGSSASSFTQAGESRLGRALPSTPAPGDRCWRPTSGVPEQRDIRPAPIHGPPLGSMPIRTRKRCIVVNRQSARQFDQEGSVSSCEVIFRVENSGEAKSNGAILFLGTVSQRVLMVH